MGPWHRLDNQRFFLSHIDVVTNVGKATDPTNLLTRQNDRSREHVAHEALGIRLRSHMYANPLTIRMRTPGSLNRISRLHSTLGFLIVGYLITTDYRADVAEAVLAKELPL